MRKEIPSGVGGKIAEYFVLGEVKKGDPEYKKEEQQCVSMRDREAQFLCLVNLVKRFQPYDAENPTKMIVKDLMIEVADLFGLENEKDMGRLKILTAVGSLLDFKFKADAIAILEEKDGKRARISKIDVTEHAPTLADAEGTGDVVMVDISNIPDPNAEPKKYVGRIGEIARDIANDLKSKNPVVL